MPEEYVKAEGTRFAFQHRLKLRQDEAVLREAPAEVIPATDRGMEAVLNLQQHGERNFAPEARLEYLDEVVSPGPATATN